MAITTSTAAAATGGLSSAGLGTVLLGAALAPTDLFIVNVALPTIEADLRASAAALEWIVAGYGIAFALLLVVGGRLGDAFGRRRLFVAGLAAFTLTSLACGLAPGAGALVAARIAQGAAAALLVPQVLSIIQAGTSGARRSRALGYYAATGGVAMVLGQVLGGALTTAGSDWRPLFLLNVPVGVLGLVFARRTLPESLATEPLGVDRWGTLLLGAMLATLLVPVLEGRALGWPLWCWIMLAACPFAAAAFVAVERRREGGGLVPLLPISLLGAPGVARGLLMVAAFFVGFGGFMFVYSLTLQGALHLSPLGYGPALAPLAVAFLVASLLSNRLVVRFGFRVVAAGAATQLTGLLALIAATLLTWPDLDLLHLAPGTVLCGLGQGLAGPTLFRAVLAGVPAESAGVGSGVLTTTQQASLAAGVALLGTVFLTVGAAAGAQAAIVTATGIQAVLVAGIALAGARFPRAA